MAKQIVVPNVRMVGIESVVSSCFYEGEHSGRASVHIHDGLFLVVEDDPDKVSLFCIDASGERPRLMIDVNNESTFCCPWDKSEDESRLADYIKRQLATILLRGSVHLKDAIEAGVFADDPLLIRLGVARELYAPIHVSGKAISG